jgi:hypothetical protein
MTNGTMKSNMNTNARTSTTDLDFSYRAALALNNMGVSLLEQGCFHEGLRPFKDSLSIMKGILGLRFGEPQHTHIGSTNSVTAIAVHDDENHSNVQLKMQHAATLLAECQTTMGKSRTGEASEAATFTRWIMAT